MGTAKTTTKKKTATKKVAEKKVEVKEEAIVEQKEVVKEVKEKTALELAREKYPKARSITQGANGSIIVQQ